MKLIPILFASMALMPLAYSIDLQLADYEDVDPAVSLTTPDPSASIAIVSGGGAAPIPSSGAKMLQLSWTGETDRKVEVKHDWGELLRFDLDGNDRLFVDLYIPAEVVSTADGASTLLGLWDDVIGWQPTLDAIITDQWVTYGFDISANAKLRLNVIHALILENLGADAGVIYIDNLRVSSALIREQALHVNGPLTTVDSDVRLTDYDGSGNSTDLYVEGTIEAASIKVDGELVLLNTLLHKGNLDSAQGQIKAVLGMEPDEGVVRSDSNHSVVFGGGELQLYELPYQFVGPLQLVSPKYSTVWGVDTIAAGFGVTVWGRASSAHSDYATAWGVESNASAYNSTAMGYHTIAINEHSTVVGVANIGGSESVDYSSASVLEPINLSGSLDTDPLFEPNFSFDSALVLDPNFSLDIDPLMTSPTVFEVGVGEPGLPYDFVGPVQDMSEYNAVRRNGLTVMRDGRVLAGKHSNYSRHSEEALTVSGVMSIADYAYLNADGAPLDESGTPVAPSSGAIRYSYNSDGHKDFIGYVEGNWVSLTGGGNVNELQTPTSEVAVVAVTDDDGTVEITPVGDSSAALTISQGGTITMAKQGNISMGSFQ